MNFKLIDDSSAETSAVKRIEFMTLKKPFTEHPRIDLQKTLFTIDIDKLRNYQSTCLLMRHKEINQ